MYDRDFYTADGRDWFEPGPDALEEKEIIDGVMCVRTCTWTHTGGISGVFSEWSEWTPVIEEEPAPFIETHPF